MARDTDHLAGGLDSENTGGLLTGFLAEEEEFDPRSLWRLGSWGAASLGAVIVALYASQSSIGLRREQLAAADVGAHAVETAEEAVRGADVVCLCTSASEPVISSDWLAPGMHVTSVGYNPPGGELDRRVIEQGHLFVETRQAFEPPPAGCGELVGFDPGVGTELGEVLLGRSPGRQSEDELTVYKAMGHACEDLAAAGLVYQRAKQDGAGRTVEF